jgi:hypothetical protein
MENEISKSKKETKIDVTVSIKKIENRSERREDDGELVPTSHIDSENTITFSLSADQVKNIVKAIGDGLGESVKEMFNKEGD